LTEQHGTQCLAQLFALCSERGLIWRSFDGGFESGRMRKRRRRVLGLPGRWLSSAVDTAPFLTFDATASRLPAEPLAFKAPQIDGNDAHAFAHISRA
jgi:hypothetical protein